MINIIPHLKMCAIAVAIASLAACGGGDTATKDECADPALTSPPPRSSRARGRTGRPRSPPRQ